MRIERRNYSRWYTSAPQPGEPPQQAAGAAQADADTHKRFRQLVPRLLFMAERAEVDIVIEEDLQTLTGHVMLEAGELILFLVGDEESFSALAELIALAGGAAFDARRERCRVEVWVDLARRA